MKKLKRSKKLKSHRGEVVPPDVSPPQSGTISAPAVQSEPLTLYLKEVQKYPILNPEEEIRLARQLRDDGDLEAAKHLVRANLRLVVKIAFEYRNIYLNVLDLIQEGNIGLMKAVSKFEPEKGAKLSYYASWWIRSYILKFILDNFRLVRIGTTQAQKKLFYQLMREKEKLEAQGLSAGPKLLAEKLDVKEKDVIEMQHRLSGAGAEVSLETPVSSEPGGMTHKDFFPDPSQSVDETLAHEQLLGIVREEIDGFMEKLNDRERTIMKERLLAERPKTLQEVANLYGLTRERVRQIEKQILEKLRAFISPKVGG